MVSGQTKSGFKYKVDPEAFNDDWEIVELAADQEKAQSPAGLLFLYKRILGEKQYESLKKHCIVNGHVSTKMIESEVQEIVNFAKDESVKAKNS